MDVLSLARGVGPVVGAGAATATVAGGATFGAITFAGNSDGGTAGALASSVGSPMILGPLAGVLAGAVGGSRISSIGKIAAIPAGIAGAVVGGKLARAGLEHSHSEEYSSQRALIDDAVTRTQDVLRTAGASDSVLARVEESYDRSFFNARFAPPRGPFGDDIKVGRSAETGEPLGTLDVVAHEFGHKVIHAYAPDLLGRSGDGAAIHESVADTIAMAVDTDDWTIGEDAIPGGMRSISHPEERGAVRNGASVAAPITREQLEGGAEEHLGAGVGNKAAYRIGSALGREEMAALYVAALQRGTLGKGATYADLADALRSAAADRYGADSSSYEVVDDAWTQAGY